MFGNLNRNEYPRFPFVDVKLETGGPLAAVPEIEAVPQAENTVRVAVRFPCGCMKTIDIPLSRLGPGREDTERYLGGATAHILEKLTKDAEEHHGGTDPKPIIGR